MIPAIIILSTLILTCIIVWFIHLHIDEKHSVEKLTNILFPSGKEQVESTIDEIDAMTQGRFTREDLLDYYLKIKGLQIIDLHATVDSGIRRFLMKPTHIRLTYFEQVKFYEIYLNYPQATGRSIFEH